MWTNRDDAGGVMPEIIKGHPLEKCPVVVELLKEHMLKPEMTGIEGVDSLEFIKL